MVAGARWLVIALAATVLLPVWTAYAKDDDAARLGMSRGEYTTELRRVRALASKWMRYRKKLVQICPTCRGSGTYRWRTGRVVRSRTCPHCKGHKYYMYESPYVSIHYNLRSGRYRETPNRLRNVKSAYLRDNPGAAPRYVRRMAISNVRLLSRNHATFDAVFHEPKATEVVRVLGVQDGKKTKWYLYTEGVDGPWAVPEPTPVEEREPNVEPTDGSVSIERPRLTSLSPSERKSALQHVASCVKYLRVVRVAARESELVISATTPKGKPLFDKERADRDIIAFVRSIWTKGMRSPWHVVTWQLMTVDPAATGVIDWEQVVETRLVKPTFDKIHWENLAQREAIALFDQAVVPRHDTDGRHATVNAPSAKPPELKPVADEEKAAIDAMRKASLRFEPAQVGIASNVLHVTLTTEKISPERISQGMAWDAHMIAKALWSVSPRPMWSGIHLEFVVPYRDKFGAVSRRTFGVVDIHAELVDSLRWNALDPEESLRFFNAAWYVHEDAKPWSKSP